MMALRGKLQSPLIGSTQTLCPCFVGFKTGPLLEKNIFLVIPFPIQ